MRTDRGRVRLSSRIWQTELSPADQDPAAEKLAVLTGTDGVFRFRVEAPVKFRLFVAREGHVSTPSGSDAPAFEAGVEEPPEEIVIRLAPKATITGRVIDVDTDVPVPGLHVAASYLRRTASQTALCPAVRARPPTRMDDPNLARRLTSGQELRVTTGAAMIQIRTQPVP